MTKVNSFCLMSLTSLFLTYIVNNLLPLLLSMTTQSVLHFLFCRFYFSIRNNIYPNKIVCCLLRTFLVPLCTITCPMLGTNVGPNVVPAKAQNLIIMPVCAKYWALRAKCYPSQGTNWHHYHHYQRHNDIVD